MELRKDALTAASAFVVGVEEYARSVAGLRATVGKLDVLPGAVNVVPEEVRLSLDVRHAEDAIRQKAIQEFLELSATSAERRRVRCRMALGENHPSVPSNPRLTDRLVDAARAVGHEPLRMVSGAGHDAAVLAGIAPMAMLFVRSPGGVSHHPDETVRPGDVQAALETLVSFLHRLAGNGMNLFALPEAALVGTTPDRSRQLERSTLPGWENTEIVVLISPHLGTIHAVPRVLAVGAVSARRCPASSMVYVLEGESYCRRPEIGARLSAGGYFVPPTWTPGCGQVRLQTERVRKALCGSRGTQRRDWSWPRQDVQGMPFMGDADALLKTLLPTEPAFDLPSTSLRSVQRGVADGGNSRHGA